MFLYFRNGDISTKAPPYSIKPINNYQKSEVSPASPSMLEPFEYPLIYSGKYNQQEKV